jgi:hypothetical protein
MSKIIDFRGKMVRLGRKPTRFDKRTLHFGDYDNLAAPPIEAFFPSPDGDAPYLMFANGPDPAFPNIKPRGDCTFAGAGNRQIQVSTAAGNPLVPDTDILVSEYDQMSPGDDGCVMLDVLNRWRKTGIAGRTIGAFASVRPRNRLHVMQAIANLEGLYCGWLLPDEWLDAAPGAVWDTGEPNRNNGHCMLVVGYDAVGVTVVTWGALQKITWAGFETCCEEAYAIVSDDMLEPDGESPIGLNTETLLLDLGMVT